MSQTYAEQILEKELKLKELEIERQLRSKDAPQVIGHSQGKYRLTRGSQVSDSRCEAPFQAGGCGALGGDYFTRKREQRTIWDRKNIKPLDNNINNLKKEIEKLKEKQSLPYLRTDIMTTSQELQQLQKDDPLFRQKKTDLSKELFEQAQELDTLEKKYNLFGNIPSLKPEIITPDPVVQTTTELGAINTRPLIIGGIVGLVGLFLIWRFK